jgi:hypothetical protein
MAGKSGSISASLFDDRGLGGAKKAKAEPSALASLFSTPVELVVPNGLPSSLKKELATKIRKAAEAATHESTPKLEANRIEVYDEDEIDDGDDEANEMKTEVDRRARPATKGGKKRKNKCAAVPDSEREGSTADDASSRASKKVRRAKGEEAPAAEAEQADSPADARAVDTAGPANPAESEEDKLKRTVFVGNVRPDCAKVLKRHFKQYGQVESIRFRSVAVLLASKIGRKEMFLAKEFKKERKTCNAYIVFANTEEAAHALDADGSVFEGAAGSSLGCASVSRMHAPFSGVRCVGG